MVATDELRLGTTFNKKENKTYVTREWCRAYGRNRSTSPVSYTAMREDRRMFPGESGWVRISTLESGWERMGPDLKMFRADGSGSQH